MVALLYQFSSHTSPHSLTMVSSLWSRLEQEAALLAGHELFRLAEEVTQVNWEKYCHLIPSTRQITSAANRLIGEVVQSRRRPLLGPSPS